MMFPAECAVYSGTVDLVCKDTFRIFPCTLSVTFCRFYQASRFIVWIEGELFNPAESVFISAHIKLCTKFSWIFRLSPYDRAKERLCEAYNPALDTVCTFPVHVFLLFIQLQDGQIVFGFFFLKWCYQIYQTKRNHI